MNNPVHTSWYRCRKAQMLLLLHLFFALLASACRDSHRADEEYTSAIIIPAPELADTSVIMLGTPVFAGLATLELDTSIGVSDGPGEYVLTSIASVAVDNDTSVYIIDRSVPVLRRYTAAGSFANNIGLRGQGPGEYVTPTGVAIDPQGRVLVLDPSQRRISVFKRTGEFITSWPTFEQIVDMTPDRLSVTDKGVIWLKIWARDVNHRSRRDVAFVRYRLDGTLIDTIHAPALPVAPIPKLRVPAQGGFRVASIPYATGPAWALSNKGYFVTGLMHRYAIDLRIPARAGAAAVRTSNDSVISIRRNIPTVAVTDEERDLQKNSVESFLRVDGRDWRWDGPEIPRIKPAFREILVDHDGRLWVHVSVPSEKRVSRTTHGTSSTWIDPVVYDVIEPSGRYLGQVGMPPGVRFVTARASFVWAVSTDDANRNTVRRYRIIWSQVRGETANTDAAR